MPSIRLALAQIVRTGWYREVEVKSLACHEVRADLLARSRLVASRRDLENQMRGLLKPFGLLVGKVRGRGFEGRVRELIADAPAIPPCSSTFSFSSSDFDRAIYSSM